MGLNWRYGEHVKWCGGACGLRVIGRFVISINVPFVSNCFFRKGKLMVILVTQLDDFGKWITRM